MTDHADPEQPIPEQPIPSILTPELLARCERLSADRVTAWLDWSDSSHTLGVDHPETRRLARACQRLECLHAATYGDPTPRRADMRDEIDRAPDAMECAQALLVPTDLECADVTKAIAIVRRLSRELNAEIPPKGPPAY